MRSFLLWAIRATLVVSSSARTCYFPDGTPTGTDVPCDGDAEDSFCCFTGQACLSNKICGAFHTNTTGTSLVYARGTCTDPTWNSPACPKFCLDVTHIFGNPMYSCNTTADAYCCNDGCACDAAHEVHTFDAQPYTQTIISKPATFANPSATSTRSASASASATSAAPANASTSAAAAAAASPGLNGTAVGVGVGVGIGGALLVVGLALLLYRRLQRGRKRQAALGATAAAHAPAEVPGGAAFDGPAWKHKSDGRSSSGGQGPLSSGGDFSADDRSPPQYHRGPLDPRGPPEAPTSPFVPELADARPVGELPGAPTAHEVPGQSVRM